MNDENTEEKYIEEQAENQEEQGFYTHADIIREEIETSLFMESQGI